MYSIYKASVSPSSAQQIMPYLHQHQDGVYQAKHSSKNHLRELRKH
jgi:hypothetical protein